MERNLDNYSDKSKLKHIDEMLRPLELPPSTLERIIETFNSQLNFGLSSDENERKKTALPMLKTYFTVVPAIFESGTYLGIDLGSTNFRIIMATFNGSDEEYVTENEPVPRDLLAGSCIKLFDYMAAKLSTFLETHGLREKSLKLGFTFSLPFVSDNIHNAKLITWVDDYAFSDGEGEDCVQLFQEAINRRGDLNVEIACVLNDTTATLLTGAHKDKDCMLGVIFGSGSNAAYFLEDVNQRMIYNIEWGALPDNGCLGFVWTSFDDAVDGISIHPGSFTFGKMLGGLYCGEYFRVVLGTLAEAGLFLQDSEDAKRHIPRPWELKTAVISPIYNDRGDGDFPNTIEMLRKIGLLQYCSNDDIALVHHVGMILRQRTADVAAAACATLVRRSGRTVVTIGFDGSYYKKLPGLSQLMESRLNNLCPDVKIKTTFVHDGSGRGGALAAAIAKYQRK